MTENKVYTGNEEKAVPFGSLEPGQMFKTIREDAKFFMKCAAGYIVNLRNGTFIPNRGDPSWLVIPISRGTTVHIDQD